MQSSLLLFKHESFALRGESAQRTLNCQLILWKLQALIKKHASIEFYERKGVWGVLPLSRHFDRTDCHGQPLCDTFNEQKFQFELKIRISSKNLRLFRRRHPTHWVAVGCGEIRRNTNLQRAVGVTTGFARVHKFHSYRFSATPIAPGHTLPTSSS